MIMTMMIPFKKKNERKRKFSVPPNPHKTKKDKLKNITPHFSFSCV